MALITQPATATIAELSAALTPSVTAFDASVAYVTFSGVRELLSVSRLKQLRNIRKQFLVGIDWFRSEPAALDMLASLPNGHLRVVDGSYVISRPKCQPRRSFHPKAYLITAARSTLIVGSANMSQNGLRASIELSLRTCDNTEIAAFREWFSSAWETATPWERLRANYREMYVTAKSREFVFTDDDDVPADVMQIRWVNPETLRKARAAQNLWIDVGGLHNRDPQDLPGTDLQFPQMTRVFFGYPPRIVPGNTPLLDIPLTMSGAQAVTRPMVFNNASSMDRLSLPVPGEGGWPAQYDFGCLLFTKAGDGTFLVKKAGQGERAEWRRLSMSTGFVDTMPRGQREWGVF